MIAEGLLAEFSREIVKVEDEDEFVRAAFSTPNCGIVWYEPHSVPSIVLHATVPVIITTTSWYRLSSAIRKEAENIIVHTPDADDFEAHAKFLGKWDNKYNESLERFSSYPQFDMFLSTGVAGTHPPDKSTSEIVETLRRSHPNEVILREFVLPSLEELFIWISDNNLHHPNSSIVVKADLLRRKVSEKYIIEMLLCCRGGGTSFPRSLLFRKRKPEEPEKPKLEVKKSTTVVVASQSVLAYE